MKQKPIALVLGATGGIGGETTRLLLQRGYSVRALHRRASEMEARPGLRWIPGDVMVAEDVARAAAGTSLIVPRCQPARLPQLGRDRGPHGAEHH